MSRPRIIALLLALVTLVVYLPATHYDFVNYDDQDYVTANSAVQNGLTLAGIWWAFTTGHASNWHPLTWLSLMADHDFFGTNSGGYHLVNVLFHIANTLLLFALMLRLTRFRRDEAAPGRPADALWPSAFIAALFAWHPLHVESVAWISERKDVLSTFFALLALLSYARFAQENCRRSFWCAWIFFAIGLMAKPMLVTLPFVMLLLDYWPLQRSADWKCSTTARLLLEKWPFLLLTLASCVITFLVQSQKGGDAVASLDIIPLHYRLCNSLMAYGRYLLNMLWPVNLAVIYPLSSDLARMIVAAAASAVVLLVISWLVWRVRRTHPYLLVGWFWYLGTLVPVIGLVQVGSAALADRYTYIPLIGIFIAITFGVSDLAKQFQIPKIIPAAAAALILAICLVLTEKQLHYWRNSETLFAHALAVTKDNHAAHVNLGVVLEEQGKLNDALEQYRAAEQLAPELYHIHSNLGGLLDKLGRPDAALIEYRKAAALNPQSPFLHNSLGETLAELGRFHEAKTEFTNAMRLNPNFSWPHFELAKTLLKEGRDAEAIGEFRAALRLDPQNINILAYVANVLAADENPAVRNGKTALVLAIKANALADGVQPFALDALGMACAETGDFTNAIAATQKALALATATKMTGLEPLQQRLQLYQNHRPWRESFRATNAPVETLPKN